MISWITYWFSIINFSIKKDPINSIIYLYLESYHFTQIPIEGSLPFSFLLTICDSGFTFFPTNLSPLPASTGLCLLIFPEYVFSSTSHDKQNHGCFDSIASCSFVYPSFSKVCLMKLFSLLSILFVVLSKSTISSFFFSKILHSSIPTSNSFKTTVS